MCFLCDKLAYLHLKNSDVWHHIDACDIYHKQPELFNQHAEELYNKYKDPDVGIILAEGITQLCSDIQVDPQDVVMLVLSWHMKAATMCEYSKEEFTSGLKCLGIDSIERFHERIEFMRSELQNEKKFQEIYKFAFGWGKEKGQKSLALNAAIALWQLLFAGRQWPLLEHWCQYLQSNYGKAISEDTWSQLLEFSKTVDPALSNYDAAGAWPFLIDEFVDHLNEKGIVQTTQTQPDN